MPKQDRIKDARTQALRTIGADGREVHKLPQLQDTTDSCNL